MTLGPQELQDFTRIHSKYIELRATVYAALSRAHDTILYGIDQFPGGMGRLPIAVPGSKRELYFIFYNVKNTDGETVPAIGIIEANNSCSLRALEKGSWDDLPLLDIVHDLHKVRPYILFCLKQKASFAANACEDLRKALAVVDKFNLGL